MNRALFTIIDAAFGQVADRYGWSDDCLNSVQHDDISCDQGLTAIPVSHHFLAAATEPFRPFASLSDGLPALMEADTSADNIKSFI